MWSRNLLLKEETDKPTHLNNIHHSYRFLITIAKSMHDLVSGGNHRMLLNLPRPLML